MASDASLRAAGQVTGHGLLLPSLSSSGADIGDSRPLGLSYARYLSLSAQRFLSVESDLPEALRPDVRRAQALVRLSLARNQKATLGCFAASPVGTPLQCLGLRHDLPEFAARIDEAGRDLTPHLLLEMALRKLIPEGTSIVWPHGAPALASPLLGGRIVPPAGATGLRFSASHLAAIGDVGGGEGGGGELGRVPFDPAQLMQLLESRADGFSFARAWHRVGKITRLALVDHNPIAQFEAHPDKQGNPIGLGDKDLAEWLRILEEAFALIERHLPGEYAEMGMMLHELIPVGYDAHRHLSCSYREAIGTVWLTLHDNVMTMAEALVHEFQHNKINCAAYSAGFIENAFYPHYKSPVRPDPRPLWGILLAVHAFLPVAQLYRNMRDAGHPMSTRPDWLRRMSEIDLKNHEGMEMLRANAQWAPAGKAMLAELEGFEAAHMAERAAQGLAITPTDVHLA